MTLHCPHCNGPLEPDLFLNAASLLPPVRCPLVIKLDDGELVRVVRTSFIRDKDGAMEYREIGHAPGTEGRVIVGRFPWTYP